MDRQLFINLLSREGYALGEAIRITDAAEKAIQMITDITPVISRAIRTICDAADGKTTE